MQDHPFFEGVEWDDIGDQTPPYSPPELVLPEPKLVRVQLRRASRQCSASFLTNAWAV
jgi:hypothetical protein